jgi:glutamate/tyrosine decarboxylase-like PLP-dependent enzyme
LASEFARRVDDEAALERIAPVHLALVCFAHRDGNEATDALVAAINADRRVYVTPSQVGDRRFVRVAIGQTRTAAEDVDRLWHVITAALEATER